MSTKQIWVHVNDVRVGDKLYGCRVRKEHRYRTWNEGYSRWGGYTVQESLTLGNYTPDYLQKNWNTCEFLVERQDVEGMMQYVKGQGWVYE